jgi:ligand-binding sensor domain-containing protein
MSLVNIPLPDTSSDLQVTALAEDHLHQIWIGTSAGHIFKLNTSRTIELFEIEEGHPSKPISGIVEDQLGQIWFATYGEGVYVYSGNRMYNIGTDDGLSGNDLYAITLTRGNQIWLGTDDGIRSVHLKGKRNKSGNNKTDYGSNHHVIKSRRCRKCSIGTFEFGLVRFDVVPKDNSTLSARSG